MGKLIDAMRSQLRPAPAEPNEPSSATGQECANAPDIETEKGGAPVEAEVGVSEIEATTAIWGKKGRWLVIVG